VSDAGIHEKPIIGGHVHACYFPFSENGEYAIFAANTSAPIERG
jgi:hypothetical protein